jgi:hypothetical protein
MSYNPKFDLDLAFGKSGEQWLTMLGAASGLKVEVKTERDTWATSGNIVFEYVCRGNPSGIAVTTADFWIHLLSLNGKVVGVHGWPVDPLKQFLRKCHADPAAYHSRLASGGDDNQSSLIIVPLSQLHRINLLI